MLLLVQKESCALEHVRKIEAENTEIFKQLANSEVTSEFRNNVFDFIDSDRKSNENFNSIVTGKLAEEAKAGSPESFICDSTELEKSEIKLKSLYDFQDTYTKRINLLQKKYEKEIELLKVQKSYQEVNRYNVNSVTEASSLANVKKHVFSVDLLNKRIENIKQLAQKEYKNLEIKLNNDSRYA